MLLNSCSLSLAVINRSCKGLWAIGLLHIPSLYAYDNLINLLMHIPLSFYFCANRTTVNQSFKINIDYYIIPLFT